jgi:hypothetical protein
MHILKSIISREVIKMDDKVKGVDLLDDNDANEWAYGHDCEV